MMLVEKSFDTGEVVLNYAEGPDNGPPLLLIQGFSNIWQYFLPIIPELSQRWHIYAPDLRGHGKSGRSQHYRMRDYHRDLEAFMKQEIQEPTAIYGHSLGGWLTMMLAANNPAMVKGIILGDIVTHLDKYVDADPSFWNYLHGLVRSKNAHEIFQSLLDSMDSHDFDTSTLLYWSKSVNLFDPEAIAQFVEMHKDGDKFREFFEGYDPDELATRITCPVLFLYGNYDLGGNISDDDLDRHSGIFSDVVSVKIEETGHMLHLKSREPVLRAVTNFLESLR